MEIGKQIKEDRQELDLTLKEVVDRLLQDTERPDPKGSVSTSWLSNVETGRRKRLSKEERQWIARALGFEENRYLSSNEGNHDFLTCIQNEVELSDRNSSLFAFVAGSGIEMHRSPQIIELYYRFLQNSGGKVMLSKMENRFETVMYLAALHCHFQSKHIETPKSEDIKEKISDLVMPSRAGKEFAQYLPPLNESIIQWLNERISIYALNPPEHICESSLFNIVGLNPVSYFCLVPSNAMFNIKSYYSVGIHEYGELKGADAELIRQRFFLMQSSPDFKRIPLEPYEKIRERITNVAASNLIYFEKE